MAEPDLVVDENAELRLAFVRDGGDPQLVELRNKPDSVMLYTDAFLTRTDIPQGCIEPC